jgi:hypothetical protein
MSTEVDLELAGRVAAAIKEIGANEVPPRDLYRKLHVSAEEFHSALDVLVERDLTGFERRPAAGKGAGREREANTWHSRPRTSWRDNVDRGLP